MKLLDLEKLIKSLSDYLTLSPHDTLFARLKILTPIKSDPDTGATLPVGDYLVDYDAKLYTACDMLQQVLPGFTEQKVAPVLTPHGEVMSIAHVIFYIGEYMKIPQEANKLLDDFFPTPIKSPRDVAIEKGALMTIGGHIAAYSTNDLKNALNAYSIMRLPASVDTTKAFDKSGKLNALMIQDKPLEGLTTMHTAFLMAIVQAVSLAQANCGDNTVSFYLPAICRDLKIDPRTYSSKRGSNGKASFSELRLNAMIELITPFDPLVGLTPDGSYYRVLTFESYDKASDTITVSTPYLYKLKAIAAQNAADHKHPHLNQLLHGAVVNEPNRAAVELASRILTGIVNRGIRADYRTYKAEPKVSKKTITRTGSDGRRTTTTTVYDTDDQREDTPQQSKIVTYKVKYSTLINDCPQLKCELIAIEAAEPGTIKHPAQAYNNKLRNVFEAAYRIIAEKSDAPARYLDFTLPMITRTVKGIKRKAYDVPTKSTLTRNMIITHKGQNPQFSE